MLNPRKKETLGKIAVVGNYLPRACGIATFTTDLSQSLAKELKSEKNLINVAIDDTAEGYNYPPQVKFRIRQNIESDYFWAADYLNANQYDAVIVQHEYGIYGGENGSYILNMIKCLKMPVITNLHTILETPSGEQKIIIQNLAKYSDKLLVMSQKAIELLTNIYEIDENSISFIPHGIPDTTFKSPGIFNQNFGFKNKDIILTFGLLGPNKGIESMIEAMPLIVEKHPETMYVILGQTHPHILEESGDSYRHNLQQLINKLGMENHIIFHNHFVNIETLIKYIQTAKIYSIPYLKKEQITSGTLAYALGLGTAVVSTPFWHAEELLSNNRGKLVPFNTPTAMAKEINNLLSNNQELETIRVKGYQYGRSITWKEVAKMHLKVISQIKERKAIENFQKSEIKSDKIFNDLPEINLSHLKTLTDDTGLLQHAKYNVPNLHHGYCVDDNARGLIATVKYYSLKKEKDVLNLIKKYLGFLFYAFNTENGRFRNFMSYERRWLELAGSEDSHSRSLWALGITVKDAPDTSIRNMAMRLFLEALPAIDTFTSPRAWAYSILGLQSYLSIYSGDISARKIHNELVEKLYELFKNNSSSDWMWFENKATYANAILPHALIIAGNQMSNPDIHHTGIQTLKWLLKIQTSSNGHLSVIGNNGWLDSEGNRAVFDQQPIEVKRLIDACLDAYITTEDKNWLKESEKCLGWFLGQNDLQLTICDYKTGGCFDGLESQGINSNQGAESTLSWLISVINIHNAVGLKSYFEKNTRIEPDDTLPFVKK